jgi:predicted nucleic acid-binding protein
LARIRDKDDWPALALALQLECAIWSTNTVQRYLES